MPQLQLPLFPVGVTPVTADLSFQKQAGTITYFYGSLPIFSHPEDDIQSFRMITAQFCVNGHTKQADIVRAFGLPKISVKRAVKRYRTEGPKGFYQKKKGRGPSVLTPSVLAQVQQCLDDGTDVAAIALELDIKADTLSKAIRAGRLHQPKKKAQVLS